MKPKDVKKLASITRATYALVQESGLAPLTLADIARGAGIATSTLYIYYPSKQALLDALYEQAKSATCERLTRGAGAQLPPKLRIRQIWLNMLNNRLDHPAEMVFQEQYVSSRFMSESNRELGKRFVREFDEVLEAGQRDETLKPVALPFLGACILGSVRETARLIAAGVLPDDESTRTTGFQLCWDALKA
ncbi:TetR/AcrR family transcriptional regulator [Massilia antarctica]|uniref:TetR/AcrR family transcriptional regulator n=1 Tax=Massilia antarctica TaxID=2765360 RepID=A0AA48WBP3_9BURK|nr:TetR/AcrR family transcriptional regulator [Massilia antarctica]QPI48748.1 TetR/AcrR family transcriptional regulator [Massilia antarctica]